MDINGIHIGSLASNKNYAILSTCTSVLGNFNGYTSMADEEDTFCRARYTSTMHSSIDETAVVPTGGRQAVRLYSDSEFTCPVCYELMVEPTTLSCGHTLCMHCLARWVLQSKKRECPECKQVFSGCPNVNFVMR